MQESIKRIIGFESTCDETAVAILEQQSIRKVTILTEQIVSQTSQHALYKGVVPEIAARAHIEMFPKLLHIALNQSKLTLSDIDIVAVSTGPGLVGGLLVGSMYARALALRHHWLCLGINHLEGHLLSPRISTKKNNQPNFPYLVLLASGGHTLIALAHELGKYQILGQSYDDALGEMLDKSATVMGLSYPGGPQIENLAQQGDSQRFYLPRPLIKTQDRNIRMNCAFSFSGIKTAVARSWEKLQDKNNQSRADMAASIQQAVAEILVNRLNNALHLSQQLYPYKTSAWSVAFVGGVSANQFLRLILKLHCQKKNAELVTVPLHWCTDNAVMIAWAALERINNGKSDNHSLTIQPRWSLDKVI